MIKLSERLKAIADQIDEQTMADIGCDHGFLPLYLMEQRLCQKVIVTDISAGSLQKAKENAEKYGISNIDFRLSDGFEGIQRGEAEVAVIAGMGGLLMIKILADNPEKTTSFQKIILQPRNGQGKLRFWLSKSGFVTISERLTVEGKFICEIITVTPPRGTMKKADLTELKQEEEIFYEVPEALAEQKSELMGLLLAKKLAIEEKILKHILKSNSIKKMELTKERIRYLQEILRRQINDDGIEKID